MRRPYIYFALLLAGVFMALATVNFKGTHVSAQSSEKRWVVLFHTQSSLPSNVDQRVAGAGGTLLAQLPEVGAVAATSNNPNFATDMAKDNKVSDVVEDIELQMIPTAEQMNAQEVNAEGDGPVEAPGDDTQTGPPGDFFYTPYQWDKRRIRASNQGSYAVQQGRPEVVVAILDTGAQILPAPHPDLQANLDTARSRSFFPVSPNPNGNPAPAAWDDRNGHGSHCMSNVGAPINNFGMVGVAPRVTLVALKVLGNTGSGSFVSLAQALIYAGNNKFDVASMSLGGYLPRNNQSAQALIKFVQRAVNYARENGVTPVAALGNNGFNVSEGDFFRSFITVPAEISGVIGVSATGFTNQKAGYSNYGVGKTDVSAPGGDFTGQSPHLGLVIGAWASDSIVFPGPTYVLASGTSMACPQAAGVCALIISQHGDFTLNGNGNKLHMSPTAVESILQQTANNQPCPDTYVVPTQTCQGNAGYNNFYGKGIVDAFKAVTQ
jgi:subtilisin family serine protease